MDELISIIVPIYNTERYIDRCLESLVNQTYKKIEIILVDDGSTDKSLRKCDEWKNKDKRIKVIYKKHTKTSDTRNKGIENATGKYLFFVDSDDYIDLDIIEELYKEMIETDSDISACGFVLETYTENIPKFSETNYVADSEEAIRRLFMHDDISLAICDKLYKREIFEDIRFPVGKTHEDIGTLYKLLDKAEKICHINRAGYHYIQRNGSTVHSEYTKDKLVVIEFIEEAMKFTKDKFPKLVEESEVFYIEFLLNNIIFCRKNKFKAEIKELKKKLKKILPRILKNSKMKISMKMKSLLIAYFGCERIYKK